MSFSLDTEDVKATVLMCGKYFDLNTECHFCHFGVSSQKQSSSGGEIDADPDLLEE